MSTNVDPQKIKEELSEKYASHLPIVLHTATVKSFTAQQVQGKSLTVSHYATENYPASPFYKMISRIIKPSK